MENTAQGGVLRDKYADFCIYHETCPPSTVFCEDDHETSNSHGVATVCHNSSLSIVSSEITQFFTTSMIICWD